MISQEQTVLSVAKIRNAFLIQTKFHQLTANKNWTPQNVLLSLTPACSAVLTPAEPDCTVISQGQSVSPYLLCMAKHPGPLCSAHICPLTDQNPVIFIVDEWREDNH